MTDPGLLFHSGAFLLPHRLKAKTCPGNQGWGLTFPLDSRKRLISQQGRAGLKEALWDLCLGGRSPGCKKTNKNKQKNQPLEVGMGGSRRVLMLNSRNPRVKTFVESKVYRFTYWQTLVTPYIFTNVTHTPVTFTDSLTHMLPFDAWEYGNPFPYISWGCPRETRQQVDLLSENHHCFLFVFVVSINAL